LRLGFPKSVRRSHFFAAPSNSVSINDRFSQSYNRHRGELVLSSLLRLLKLGEAQLDELWAFVKKKVTIQRKRGKIIKKDLTRFFCKIGKRNLV
jgi:hypothetical protein